MTKVRCKVCGETGFTASPGRVICKCGGRFVALREKKEVNENH